MPPSDYQRESAADDRIARLEARIARIEAKLSLDSNEAESVAETDLESPHAGRSAEEFEFEVGQHWFAVAGVIALTLGAGFLLSLPFTALPAVLPSIIGYTVVGGLFLLARAWRHSFALVANYIRGAAMALLFAATLRLCFPLQRHVIDITALAGQLLLIVAVAINLWLAQREKSGWLAGVALATGGVTVTFLSLPWLALGLLVVLAGIARNCTEREKWLGLSLVSVPGAHVAYLGWALGPLWRGFPYRFETSWSFAPYVVLGCMAVLASGRWRSSSDAENPWDAMHALGNCLTGYAVFFAHTIVAFSTEIAIAHATAFLVLLGLAATFWIQRGSQIATFFYAMTGYAALTVAILKLAPVPTVFVWLSVQSLIVVATAIWFRSRFIVVANFLIYLAIVFGYVGTAERETGISIGFGIVALVSARILNWQRNRLELKTELMRNAYLLSAFLVFPYALYHLVPSRYVVLTWIGLAIVFYGLNLVMRNQKYRWMAHGTLVLTAGYLAIVGTRQFEPIYRVLSFLALGTVLIVVSLLFTRSRRRDTAK